MVATFFCKSGHLVTVPLQQKRTVTAQWYTEECLPKVLQAWSKKRPNDKLQHFLLHHDNAPAHTAIRTVDFLASKGARLLPHPPYSPDLAPADFFLFGYVKESLRGQQFSSAERALEAYEDAIRAIKRETWNAASQNWFKRMNTCIHAHGNYVE